MKKIVSVLLITAIMTTGTLFARGGYYYGGGGYHRGGYYHGGWGWAAPLFVGGALGYTASRPTVVYESAPNIIYTQPQSTMVIQQAPQVIQQSTPVPTNGNGVYEERWVYFDDCKCQRKVLVNMQQQ